MLLKFFIAYPYVVYSIISWGIVFIFIGIKGIKRLWPVSIVGALLLFSATYWLVSVGLYKINIDVLPILGIPFFYIIWGAGSAIVFANYLGEKSYHRILAILGFAAGILTLERLVETYGRVQHMGRFNEVYEYVFDVFLLTVLAFLITNLFRKRLRTG